MTTSSDASRPVPRTDRDPTPARRLRDAVESIAMVSVHTDDAQEQYRALGLDWFSGYVQGRAAPLGIAPTSLVVATFGVFAPSMLASGYETGLATASHADVLAAKEAGAVAALHRVLGEPGREVEEVVAVLRAGLERGTAFGRPLYAGLCALDWPGDAWGRLWHAASLLREFRGDGHIAALVASVIGPVEANILTEAHVGLPDHRYTATRGWTEAEIDDAVARLVDRGVVGHDGGLTDRGRALRDDVEAATEAGLDPVLEGMGDALETAVARCEQWSRALVTAGAFPDDRFKLAAG